MKNFMLSFFRFLFVSDRFSEYVSSFSFPPFTPLVFISSRSLCGKKWHNWGIIGLWCLFFFSAVVWHLSSKYSGFRMKHWVWISLVEHGKKKNKKNASLTIDNYRFYFFSPSLNVYSCQAVVSFWACLFLWTHERDLFCHLTNNTLKKRQHEK